MMEWWQKLAARFPQPGDAALITAAPDRRLLSGFPADDAVVVVTAQAACFLTDSRYDEAAGRAITSMPVARYRRLYESLHDWLREHGARRLFVQTEEMSVAAFDRLREELSEIEVLNTPSLDEWLRDLRAIKTPEQIAMMRRAQALTEEGFRYILPRIKAGRTEREVALDLEFAIREAGAEGVAFDFIVVAGENGSLPHGVPGDRVIRRGDLVTMDFGARVDGWHSDMTRTVAVERADDWQREIYDVVLTAQQACLDTLRAGLTASEGDAAARRVIEDAGYGDFFGHGTGHGVGLQIHEAPTMSPRATTHCFREGEVVTVEPGIYLPGRGGVRIEDMVVITADGCENLTRAEKKLLIL